MGDDELLIRVKAAAVNPVDILNLTGAVRLIQDDSMPLTLGNECAGIVEKAGRLVTRFRPGDRVYARLPVGSLVKWLFPLQGVGSARHRLVADQRCLAAGGGRINGKVILRLQSFCRKCSGLRNQAAVFISTLLYQIMHGGYRNTLFADCLQKIGDVPLLTLDKYPQGVYNADTPWGYT